MAPQISEKQITNKALKWLNSQNGCSVKKRLASMANGGEPDITGGQKFPVERVYEALGLKFDTDSYPELPQTLIPCIRVEIEMKRPGEKLSDRQARAIAKWAEAGAITFVAYSLEEVQRMYNFHMEVIVQTAVRHFKIIHELKFSS